MKLKTWRIYEAKNLMNLNNQLTIKNDLYILVLRPDIHQPNRTLVLGLPKPVSSLFIVDLQNRILEPKRINENFKDYVGSVSSNDITESKFTKTPIRQENINMIVDMYSVFIKKETIEWETEDYATIEQMNKHEDIFAEVNFEKMSFSQMMATLGAGMKDWITKSNELKNLEKQLNESNQAEYNFRKDVLFSLQRNLILFFDQTLKRLDVKMSEQNNEIRKLREEFSKLKGDK